MFSEGVGRARRGRECALFLEAERDETSSSSFPGADLLLCLERETCFFLSPGRRESEAPLAGIQPGVRGLRLVEDLGAWGGKQ